MAILAAAASAAEVYQGFDDVYHGLAAGNGDLYPHNLKQGTTSGSGMVGTQPGVGDIATGGLAPRGKRNPSGPQIATGSYEHPDEVFGVIRQ